MAVIEIAKIQVRRGQENQTGVPQLDGGEFAWAADTEKLYIGLRREDGGSRDANVEILTENHLRNFFDVNRTDDTYIYREDSTSSRVLSITAEYGTADEWERTYREKLDDTVTVSDFGVYPNTDSWDLRRLQLAIDRLFLNTGLYDTDPAKKLFFPAGTYNITGTLYIPARTTLIGEGPGKTILNLTANEGALIQTCDLTSIEGTYYTFDSGSGEGAEFTGNGAAHNIHIEDLTVKFDGEGTTVTNAASLIKLDCSDHSIVRNVEFMGHHTTGTDILSSKNYVGLTMRGTLPVGANINTRIENCIFDRVYHGIQSNYDIKSVLIENNEFKDLARGISFNDIISETAEIGPQYVTISKNRFDYIEQEAIYVGTNNQSTGSYITSEGNYFGAVGNSLPTFWGDDAETGTAIVVFESGQCVSINDHYERLRVHNQYAQENYAARFNPLVLGQTTLDNFYVTAVEVAPGITGTTILRLPVTSLSQHLDVKYSMFRNDVGDVFSVVSSSTTGSNFLYIDEVSGIVPEYSKVTLITNYTDPGTGIANYIAPNTLVAGVNTTSGPGIVEISTTASVTATTQVLFKLPLDRMGNIQAYLQDTFTPGSLFVDNYNYISQDGNVEFTLVVDNANRYYEIHALLGTGINLPVTVELQTKLMI